MLTAKSRRLLADPAQLRRVTAAAPMGGNAFTVFAGDLFLALRTGDTCLPPSASQVTATVAQAAAEEGFRGRADQP